MSVTSSTIRQKSAVLPTLVALTAGLAILGVIFLPECRAAVAVWIDSTAYGHCFLVVPIAAYLAWDRRDTIAGMLPRPTPALIIVGIPLPFAWFVAERLGIMEGRQLVVIAFMELLFLVLLGWRLFYAMLGPLLYLVFLVPFGEFLTPALQSFTAGFTTAGLTALGIPYFANDMVIEISGGTFYVAEACAGLRFLIASIAFGVFYALINYRSPGRRAAFIAASIIVPIIANGFRALGIVALGYILGSAQAAAADHIIYGWLFFSIVTLLLVAGGLPFREAPAAPRQTTPSPHRSTAYPWPALLVVALAILAPAASMALDRNTGLARLNGPATVVAPQGCERAKPENTADRMTAQITCGRTVWTLTLQAIPARSTGGGLTDMRRRLIGPLDPEGVSTSSLHDIPGTAGKWQTIVSQEPSQITGVAVWVHGQPAGGGLAQRILQARDSILGNDTPPLIAILTTNPGHRMPDTESEGFIAELARIVAAQPDFDAEARRLTATSSPPPPT